MRPQAIRWYAFLLHIYLLALLVGWLFVLASGPAMAQEITPQLGLHYFVIQELDSGQIVQRGTTGTAGIAFDSLILAPTTRYRAAILQAATFDIGILDFTTPASGRSLNLPSILLGRSTALDSDGDGLDDDGEVILGTSVTAPDTDGDGLLDSAEAQQGTDPLEGTPARTGIIATADTSGSAVDVCAFNDIVAVADSDQGVTVFNVFNRMSPVAVMQVDTPGQAAAIACAGNLLAVADTTGGLLVIDLRPDAPQPILHQIALSSTPQAVAIAGDIAYAGTTSGRLVAIDMMSGTILSEVNIGSAIQDVGVGSETLYALTVGTLHTLRPGATLEAVDAVSSPGDVGAGRRRLRLFIGKDIAYAVHTAGYNTFSLTDPLHPALLVAGNTGQFGWKQIVTNGVGSGIAAVSANSTNDGPHHVSFV